MKSLKNVVCRALFALLCTGAMGGARGWCQGSEASARLSASSVPASRLMQPAALNQVLQAKGDVPAILQVGSRVFFEEAHIRGSVYAGAGSQPAGLRMLEHTVASWPKDKAIVMYCGCCPWDRCPNVGPAYKRLQELGFTNVKVLYLANNFGDDWVSKGYATDRH